VDVHVGVDDHGRSIGCIPRASDSRRVSPGRGRTVSPFAPTVRCGWNCGPRSGGDKGEKVESGKWNLVRVLAVLARVAALAAPAASADGGNGRGRLRAYVAQQLLDAARARSDAAFPVVVEKRDGQDAASAATLSVKQIVALSADSSVLAVTPD